MIRKKRKQDERMIQHEYKTWGSILGGITTRARF